jgi:hypothetical protein
MSRRLALTVFALLLLAPATATAAADERDNARAFADIGVRATAAVEAAQAATDRAGAVAPRCTASHRLRVRGTKRQRDAVESLFAAQWIARYARRATPVVARAAAELQAVPTEDPALRSGRTAWRRVLHAYRRFGALESVHVCSEVRDYVRGDFRRTPAMVAAARMYRRAVGWDTSDIDARLAGAVTRLVELGVPTADADAFDGDIDN